MPREGRGAGLMRVQGLGSTSLGDRELDQLPVSQGVSGSWEWREGAGLVAGDSPAAEWRSPGWAGVVPHAGDSGSPTWGRATGKGTWGPDEKARHTASHSSPSMPLCEFLGL